MFIQLLFYIIWLGGAETPRAAAER